MNDIKLYAAKEKQLKDLLKLSETFTSNTKMQFEMNKSKVLHINQMKKPTQISTINNETFDNMNESET